MYRALATTRGDAPAAGFFGSQGSSLMAVVTGGRGFAGSKKVVFDAGHPRPDAELQRQSWVFFVWDMPS